MAQHSGFRSKLSSILFWSIISAAFIGPGTVTTAAKAGALFQVDLLWALVFSIIATVVLQEAAARLTIASGKNLGEIVVYQFGKANILPWALFLGVAFGCAAYEAGNMLGAVSGLLLFEALPAKFATILLGTLCFGFLMIGNFKTIARMLSLVVALMGIVFIYVSFFSEISLGALLKHSVVPFIPEGAGLYVIGLIGTTIVPYNLFLASGISQGQSIGEMRLGITVSILIGGIISLCILLVGTQVNGTFSFEGLAATLSDSLGKWAGVFFGLGLFAAGMSSSITAPLAAAVTAQSLLGKGAAGWQSTGWKFRLVWISILGIGLLFGLLDIQPIPAIILAQAINGALLPVVAVFLFMAANDSQLLGPDYVNKSWTNAIMLLIVGISCFLGLNNMVKAGAKMLQVELGAQYLWWIAGLSVLISLLMAWKWLRQYRLN